MSETQLDSLIEWSTSHGATIDDRIQFQITSDSGISAVYRPKSTVSHDQLQVKIPKQIIITPQVAQGHFGICDLSLVDPVSILKLYLSDGDIFDGFYSPYLACLPSLRDIGSPLSFCPEELSLLNGTNICSGVPLKLQALITEYKEILGQVGLTPAKEYSDLTASQLYETVILEQETTTNHSFGRHIWAHLILTSRAFPYRLVDSTASPKSVMLLPLVDLFNNKPNSKVSWVSSNDGFELQVEKTENMEEGAEILNNYGPKGNEELFMGYGFTIEDNEFENLHLTLDVSAILLPLKESQWNISLPRISGYTYSVLDESPTEPGNNDNSVVYMCNKNHLLPAGLLELYCFMSRNPGEEEMTLKSKLNGINLLRYALETKFKDKMDKLTSLPQEVVDQRALGSQYDVNYGNIRRYKKSQLGVLNLVKNELKREEKTILKRYRSKLITIKDILKKDGDEMRSLLEKLGVPGQLDSMTKQDMELVVHLWLLKTVNGGGSKINAQWVLGEFGKKRSGPVSELSPELKEMFAQIGGLGDSLKGELWDVKTFSVVDQIYTENSYEKGSSYEPILIEPTVI